MYEFLLKRGHLPRQPFGITVWYPMAEDTEFGNSQWVVFGAAAVSNSLVIPGGAADPGQGCGFQMSLLCSQAPVCPSLALPRRGELALSFSSSHTSWVFLGAAALQQLWQAGGLLSNVSGQASLIPNKQEFNRRLGKKKEKKPTHHKKHPTDKRKKNNPKPKGPKATPNHQQKQNPPKQKQKLNPTKITPPTNKLIISCLLKDTT